MKPSKKTCGNCSWLSKNCDETYEGELKGKAFCVFVDGDPKYLNEIAQCPKLTGGKGK